MCRVNLHHTFRYHIPSASLFRRLDILDIDSYFHNRILRWAGHVALKVEGLARVSKNAGGRPRLASVAFDGRYMGLAL